MAHGAVTEGALCLNLREVCIGALLSLAERTMLFKRTLNYVHIAREKGSE